MQQLVDKARAVLDAARVGLALLGVGIATAGILDRFVINLPIGMPEGQALFWYVASAAIACFACR